MRIVKKVIATLLVICMMFSFLPLEMVSLVMEDVQAGVIGTSTELKIVKGKVNIAGGVPGSSIGRPSIRICLSREPDVYISSEEHIRDEFITKFSYKYPPFSKGADVLQDTLFFISTNVKPESVADNFIFATYDNQPTSGLQFLSGGGISNLMVSFTEGGSNPFSANTNSFKEAVVAAKERKEITSTTDLGRNQNWKNYLSSMPIGTARAMFNYIITYGGNMEARIKAVTDENFSISGDGKKIDELSSDEAFKLSAGYGGLLIALYQIALAEGADMVAAHYEQAITDFFLNNDLKNKPVTLLIDTCMVYTSSEDGCYCITPSIELYEYVIATNSDYAITNQDAPLEMAMMDSGGGNTRALIKAMADESYIAYPFSDTKGYSSGEITAKKVLRLIDRTDASSWGISLNESAIGWAIRVFQFKTLPAYIWMWQSGPAWSSAANKFDGYMDMFDIKWAGGNLEGFMVVGEHITNPNPVATYMVHDDMKATNDICDPDIKLESPAHITVTLGDNTEFLSFLENLKDTTAGEVQVQSRVTRIETLDGAMVETCEGAFPPRLEGVDGESIFGDGGGTAHADMAVLQSAIDWSGSIDEFIARAQQSINFDDESIMNKIYTKKKEANQTLRFEYRIDLRLYVDKQEWEFKWEDIVSTVNGVPANTVTYIIPVLDSNIGCFTEDTEIIDIPGQYGTNTTAVVNPSEKENESYYTRMLNRYEYASAIGLSDGGQVADEDIVAFAEIKSNTPLGEEYEVMGGIPSSEEIYFSVGGAEYKVAIVVQYWMNQHSRDRTYTIHFDSRICEFNNQVAGQGDSWVGIALPAATGKVTQTTRYLYHATGTNVFYDGNANPKNYGPTSVTATWRGKIYNKATPDSKDVIAGALAHPTHRTEKTEEIKAVVDNHEYVEAVAQANAWIAAMNALTPDLYWDAATDGKHRDTVFNLSDMGDGDATTEQGASGSGSDTWTESPHTSASYSYSFTNPKDVEKTVVNENECNEEEATETTPKKECTATKPEKKEVLKKDPDKEFIITVTYSIAPHALCGPCCEHVLPDIYDTWRQGLIYDYAKIGQIRLYLLNQGSVEGMQELVGTDRIMANVVSGNPTYFMNIAQMTEQTSSPYLTANAPGDLSGIQEGSGMTWMTNKTYSGVYGNDNRWEAQSSRAGRIRYVLDPTYSATTSFAHKGPLTGASGAGQGNNENLSFSLESVANSKQHDDVIYTVSRRTMNCEGMATTNNFGKSSATNDKPMDNIGHINPWADGCLYTNIQNYSGYSNYHTSSSYGFTYTPKYLKENDSNVTKYYEDYNHHIVRSGGIKAAYSDQADAKDALTPEWQVFDGARRTRIIAIVISDFLIMQTSGGDQSIFYFEKAAESAEAQEHFQKVDAEEDEMFTQNELSIFNSQDCEDPCKESSNSAYIKAGIQGFEIIGGYNGHYESPTEKYKPYSPVTNKFLSFGGTDGNSWNSFSGTYNTANYRDKVGGSYNPHGETKVITIFDDDPAGTINRPRRQATNQNSSFKIMQDNIQILPTAPNQFYQPINGKVWYSQVVGCYSPAPGLWDMETNSIGVGARNNVNLGWVQRTQYGDAWRKTWGNSTGLELNTKYFLTPEGTSDTKTVNGVLVYTPVSVEDAIVLPQGTLEQNGYVVSRDQRVNGFEFPNMNEVVNALKVCTLDPATCEYRYLDCKYLHDTILADFDFEDTYKGTVPDYSGQYEHNLKEATKKNTYKENGRWVTTNKINGIEYILPESYTVVNSSTGTGSGKCLYAQGKTAWVIPFNDLGLSNIRTNRVKISLDLKVNTTSKTMIVGFKGIAFTIEDTGKGRFIMPIGDGSGQLGARKEFSNAVGQSKVHLDIIFSFNNIVDCTAYINDVEATVSAVKDYRTVWEEGTNAQGNAIKTETKKVVTLPSSSWYTDPPKDLTTGDILGSLNIGTWSRNNSTYNANFYIDNLQIILMGGTVEHTTACYKKTVIHQTGRVHVCDAECYTPADAYSCENLPLNYYGSPTCGQNETATTQVLWNSGSGSISGSGDGDFGVMLNYGVAAYNGTVTATSTDSSASDEHQVWIYINGSSVATASNGGTCTYNFTAGQTVAVYAKDWDNGSSWSSSAYYKQGHTHTGSPSTTPNGCYTTPTSHKHNQGIQTLTCTIPEGGTGQTYNYSYSGNIQSVELPAGRYKLEVWGASGGNSPHGAGGGKGGYGSGIVTLNATTTLYIVVGGEGQLTSGGYNGGGTSAASTDSAYGGGATHIATRTGVLKDLSSYKSDILIVAGGGGAGGCSGYVGGDGGGANQNGSAGYGASMYGSPGPGGTTTGVGTLMAGTISAGFGYGGYSNNLYNSGAGGGGYYGGQAGNNEAGGGASGGGGSGYANTSKLTDISGTVGSNTGNGKVKITSLSHTHTTSCYSSTNVTCSIIPKGTHVCTGKLNSTSDLNAHEHTAECLTTCVDIPLTEFKFTGTAQTYTAPYTDYYKIEVYGPSGGSTSGYSAGTVKLTKGDLLYVYVGGTNGYHDSSSDVRFISYVDIPANVDPIEKSIYQENNNKSADTILLKAGKTSSSTAANNVGQYTLTNITKSSKVNTSNGKVVITPLNQLPTTVSGETIFDKIMSGKLSEADMEKYLGKEVMNAIRNPDGSLPQAFTSKTFNYTGSIQSITLQKGKYKLETWGAQGGGTNGGKGGYTSGVYTLTSSQKLYVYVGGQGSLCSSTEIGKGGGAFGGGHGSYGGYGGGGMTYFSTNGTDSFGTTLTSQLVNEGGYQPDPFAGTILGYDDDSGGSAGVGVVNGYSAKLMIPLTAGQKYVFAVGRYSDSRTGDYPWYIKNPSGTTIASDTFYCDEGSWSSQTYDPDCVYTFTATTSGTYTFFASENYGDPCIYVSTYGETWVDNWVTKYTATETNNFAKNSVLVLAGGGGGSGTSSGGSGGGLVAGSGGGSGGNTNTSTGHLQGLGESAKSTSKAGGGGAGWYSGRAGAAGGGGGSAYYNTTKITEGSSTANNRSGNGVAKITALEPALDDSVRDIIIANLDKIPDYVDGDYNPIWVCKFFKNNVHDCTNCVEYRKLVCTEPHHNGLTTDANGNTVCKEHYAGANKICWSACCDDSNHKNTVDMVIAEVNGKAETLNLTNFLQLDEGFTVYFPNIGDFAGNNALGLANPQITRGLGYSDNMDTTRWTREKRVKFSFDVIFHEKDGSMNMYPANSWIELDVPTVFFNFYLLVENAEMPNASVEFECEAINCGTVSGLTPKAGVSYSSSINTQYANALQNFLDNYLNCWYADVKEVGYKRQLATKPEYGNYNRGGSGNRLELSDFGYMKFYATKQENEEQVLRDKIAYMDKQIEKDFEGIFNDYMINHTHQGINETLKPITSNDNKIMVNNKMRAESLKSLHGAYKHFYLDVIGRIGNFAIVDTEDFRFSNFFKVPIITSSTDAGLNDPNNWLVEGLVLKVNDEIQNLYVGDTYDIRGNKAQVNTRWLDTYGTQSWMAGKWTGSGRDINDPNLISQILTGDVNNIEVLKKEQLRYGYDIYTSIVTMGNYENGQVQIVPKFYALRVTDESLKPLKDVPEKYRVKKGTYIPLDVYSNENGVYEAVNIFGNAANGNPNKGGLPMVDYVFNLDWKDEGPRRNYGMIEEAITLKIKNDLKEVIYDLSGIEEGEEYDPSTRPILEIRDYTAPEGRSNYLGTAQYILMNPRHRTFIGSPNSYDDNTGGNTLWISQAGTSNFGVDKGAFRNAYDPTKERPIEDIKFERAVQRWHGKLGIPSSAAFVPHGEEITSESLKWIQGENEDHWVIVCTAEIIAMGAVWNLYYSQPWFTKMSINGEDYSTGEHYPGHRVMQNGKSVACEFCLDPVIAVFGKTSVDDVEIVKIY